MKDMFKMMKQAQEVQKRVQQVQAEMNDLVVKGQAGGGAVSVEMTGGHQVQKVNISAELVDKDDVETLEDLVQVAVNDAMNAVNNTLQEKMNAATGGMSIPGLTG